MFFLLLNCIINLACRGRKHYFAPLGIAKWFIVPRETAVAYILTYPYTHIIIVQPLQNYLLFQKWDSVRMSLKITKKLRNRLKWKFCTILALPCNNIGHLCRFFFHRFKMVTFVWRHRQKYWSCIFLILRYLFPWKLSLDSYYAFITLFPVDELVASLML